MNLYLNQHIDGMVAVTVGEPINTDEWLNYEFDEGSDPMAVFEAVTSECVEICGTFYNGGVRRAQNHSGAFEEAMLFRNRVIERLEAAP